MRKQISLMMTLTILCGSLAHGQSLVPATSEDLGEFDRQIQESQRQDVTAKQKAPGLNKSENSASNESKNPKTNFGSLVSQEAKKLKDLDKSQRNGMGQWVNEQRRQNEVKNPTASQAPGSASSNANPARENSSNAPGQSGKKKK